MKYVLAKVSESGVIYALGTDQGEGWPSVIHSYTTDVEGWNGDVFTSIAAAREAWEDKPKEVIIIQLNRDGGGGSVWLSDDQSEFIESRLSRWRSCYGGWRRRKLNTGGR